jgi:methionine-rich copper-binding protein CopC
MEDEDKLENQKDYKLVVEKVKDTDGNEIAKTEKSFRAFDATLPVAESITVTGPMSFTIEFSEHIETAGTVEVKSGSYVLGGTCSISGKKATVKLYSSLTDGTTYEVTVKDFKDYAGYKNIIKTFNLAYAKDGNAPVATVEKAEQTYVKVKFDKPVTGLDKEQFWHTFTAWTAKGIYKAEGMTTADAIGVSDSVDTVWVKFADNANDKPIHEGTTVFGIEAKANNNEIKDNWGNKFASATFTITVTADKTAPEVAELKVKSEKSLEIKFSEEVVFGNDNVEVLAEDGSKIDGVSPSVSPGSGKEYTISWSKELSGKTIVVRIKDVKDKALQPNKMSLYSATLVITDKTAPDISKVTKDASNKILYVFFNEAVDNTALDKNNYGVLANGEVTLLSKDPVFFVGNKVVKLTLTDEEYQKLGSTGSLFVQKVKDLAGNAMAGQTKTISSMDGYETDKPAIATIDAVATDKIEITFNQVLKRVDKDVFRIKFTTPVAMELKTNKEGNTVVVLQLAPAAKLDANIGTTVSLGYDNSGQYKITNLFDVDANYGATYDYSKFNDKIAPSMAKKTDGNFDISVDKVAKTITIKFDEPIDSNSLSKFTYKVKDYTVVSVSVASGDTKNVVITVDKAITAGKLQITQELPVADSKGNEYKYDKTIEVDVPST